MPSRQTVTLSIAIAALVAIGPAMYFLHRKPPAQPAQLWAQLGKYCVDCHNRDDLTAGIAFDKMSPADIARDPEVFEAAIRKRFYLRHRNHRTRWFGRNKEGRNSPLPCGR